jgi:hypothetical protein
LISLQLHHILEGYGHRNERTTLRVTEDGASITEPHARSITIASLPDARSVMLFGTAGRIESLAIPGTALDTSRWTLLDAQSNDPEDARIGTVRLDDASGDVVLTHVRSIEELGGPAFDEWASQFAQELAQVSHLVEEVAASFEVPLQEGHLLHAFC